jgi:hypothetical protein
VTDGQLRLFPNAKVAPKGDAKPEGKPGKKAGKPKEPVS